MKKLFPVLLAVAVGAISGLLGAWWPKDAADAPASAQAAPPPAVLPDVDVAAQAVPQAVVGPKPPTRVDLALFCGRAAAQGTVTFRRLVQSAAARTWSVPSLPLSTDAAGLAVLRPEVELLPGRDQRTGDRLLRRRTAASR